MTGTLEHRASRSAYRLVIKEGYSRERTQRTMRTKRMTTEPSPIWKDGTAEGSQMWIMASIPGEAAKMIMKEAGEW